MAGAETQSRKALRELIDLLLEVDERWAGPEWLIESPEDVAGAHRALLHLLQGGLFGHFEDDPTRPQFRRIVSPTRKFTGDNPDAIYYEAPVKGSLAYRVRGNMAGAVYVSLTVEEGAGQGSFGSGTAGDISDVDFDVDGGGNFEVVFGGVPQERNWLALPEAAQRITTRHYFEELEYAAADRNRLVPLSIETLEPTPAPAPADAASITAGIRRVTNFVRSRTLEELPPGQREQPAFVGRTPNQFPAPVKPGDFTQSFADAAYSLAPYVLGPDEALLVTGRWPRCRAGYVCLWNRWLQTYDFANRRVGLNRKQTQLESDGSFRMVLAHRDPGERNWIDTEGRPFGMVFWRFVLPEGPIETPQARVVPFDDLART
ncbi:MAG: DUF1214 domain-containing protein [Deltaproteobacteria bacterium]|nr:DUF1214 domain-containing protein [Deltaproteobacteria bacterium]